MKSTLLSIRINVKTTETLVVIHPGAACCPFVLGVCLRAAVLRQTTQAVQSSGEALPDKLQTLRGWGRPRLLTPNFS